MTKPNISKYFNKKTEKISYASSSKKNFSAKDEEQFNNILTSTEKNSNRKKYHQKLKTDLNTEINEYSENDSIKFANLIASGEQLIKNKGKTSYRNNNEAYTNSDEELFNKHLSSTQDKTNKQNVEGRKEENLSDQKINTSESKTFEYNEKDVAQFEKLMSKK